MDPQAKIQQLEKEIKSLRQQLELSSHLNGKVKNVRHVLALTTEGNAIRENGFYYKGEDALTAAEYAQRLALDPDYQHLLGGTGSTSSNEANPWSKNSWNLTKQMTITRANPELAEKLKAAAKS